MTFDSRVRHRYENYDEDARLWKPGLGTLTRRRTWDIFARHLPATGRVADVGGGPGAHAAHLAATGHDVILLDPMPHHAATAATRPGVRAVVAEARNLPLPSRSVDIVLLMGPLYHLVERADRLAALRETARVLKPGGVLVAEIITRHAWVMDATRQSLLDDPAIWADFAWIAEHGSSKDPAQFVDGSFWAYFHRPEEFTLELADAGFPDASLVAVEGFAHLLPDLPARMTDPDELLRAVRVTESEPSMLGASPHVMAIANVPSAPSSTA